MVWSRLLVGFDNVVFFFFLARPCKASTEGERELFLQEGNREYMCCTLKSTGTCVLCALKLTSRQK